MKSNEDFNSHSHHLQRWFGITSFIIVSMADSNELVTPSDANTMLSAISIAFQNISYELSKKQKRNKLIFLDNHCVPCFVAVEERWQGKYFGSCNLPLFLSNNGAFEYNIRFDADTLPSSPVHSELEGLLNLFETKMEFSKSIYGNYPVKFEMVERKLKMDLLVRFTFISGREEWKWPYSSPVPSHDHSDKISMRNGLNPHQIVKEPKLSTRLMEDELLWYPKEDPIEALDVGASWKFNNVEECSMVVCEGMNISDDEVKKAPMWNIRCVFEEKPIALLSQRMKSFSKVAFKSENYHSINQLFTPIPSIIDETTNPYEKNDISYNMMMNVAVDSITRSLNSEFVASERTPSITEIDACIRDIFRIDSNGNSTNNLQLKKQESTLQSVKGSPFKSILSFFVIHLLNASVNLKGLALFWKEFLKEVRWCWEQKISLPNVNSEQIDLRSCLIYQKLQLLNICILNCENQEEDVLSSDDEIDFGNGWDDWDELDSNSTNSPSTKKSMKTRSVIKATENEPVALEGLYLIGNAAQMYSPSTQNQGVMTEDMLQEQEEIFFKLGESEEAQKIRARMQSGPLISDMQAFKAANEGCCLEDFVRWHSPRDWIPEDGEEDSKSRFGQLSQRFQIPGNLWQTCWNESEPKNVVDQKPLFHFVKEAEKILHYLETISPVELTKQLIAVGFSTIYGSLECQTVSSIPPVKTAFEKLTLKFRSVDWLDYESIVENIENIQSALALVEVKVYQSKSLFLKFPNDPLLVSNLLREDETIVPIEKRENIMSIFTNRQGKMPIPDAKEFIFKTSEENNSLSPFFRMYLLATDMEFRTAFSYVVPVE
eukprot:TRINITY_DN5880_c0_g1_i5.p1 TRINITY_DN5880_c0_g1~~TRINITY_DN5880_c0_g1_i5.p1  ORF type:complete len:829 (+),score=172.70 TRINITY_DN5880_c0_g1_i5:706-3192(+)